MQHPDEGIIHSWLDGALSAEDAAGVESHVGGCQQCAAAVAEARGFIAASSRILTALDDVPRGVVPVAPARKRDLRVFWRAAAAVLVVAGGSLVVMREGGQDTAVRLIATDSVASLESGTSSAAAAAPVADGAANAADASAPLRQSEVVPPSTRRAAPATTSSDLSKAAVGNASSVSGFRVRTEAAPPRILSVEPMIGRGSRTIYEIAPTQTVTLTETEPIVLRAPVTTGVQEQRARGARAISPMTAQATAAPPPAPPLADSQLRRDPAVRSTEAAAEKTVQNEASSPVSAQFNSISWTETATGKMLTLSGNLPVARLQEIKLSIERERATLRTKAP